MGAVSLCALVCLTSCFDRYRGIASGIASAGCGFGYILTPLLLHKFCQLTSWRYALLIYSLVSLVILIVSAMTFRPSMLLPILAEDAKDDEEEEKKDELEEECETQDDNEILWLSAELNDTRITKNLTHLEIVVEEDSIVDNGRSLTIPLNVSQLYL